MQFSNGLARDKIKTMEFLFLLNMCVVLGLGLGIKLNLPDPTRALELMWRRGWESNVYLLVNSILIARVIQKWDVHTRAYIINN